MEYVAVILSAVTVVLLVVVLAMMSRLKKNTGNESVSDEVRSLHDGLVKLEGAVEVTSNEIARQGKDTNEVLRAVAADQRKSALESSNAQHDSIVKLQESQTRSLNEFRDELHKSTVVQADSFANMQKSLHESMAKNAAAQNEALVKNTASQNEVFAQFQKTVGDSMLKTQETVTKSLTDNLALLQASNEKKLDEIRGVVNEKLDKTLNERLDSNFKQVSENLSKLYQSLGELQNLSSGVDNLNKTLTNVKTRGTWGEVQLGRILEQTLTNGQYVHNIITKHGSSDPVEYAICLPSSENDETVYLPVDSKFPSDMYNHIVEASDAGDAAELALAQKGLKDRIQLEARKIRDKYIDPPHTSDYAIMFLPTEGLYAEVLRLDGVVEYCQSVSIMVAGPTTITALLNTIAVGFRNAALNRQTAEVRKILEAVKAQITKLDDSVISAQRKIEQASSATHVISERTRIMRSKMNSIGTMNIEESDSVLGVNSGSDAQIAADDITHDTDPTADDTEIDL